MCVFFKCFCFHFFLQKQTTKQCSILIEKDPVTYGAFPNCVASTLSAKRNFDCVRVVTTSTSEQVCFCAFETKHGPSFSRAFFKVNWRHKLPQTNSKIQKTNKIAVDNDNWSNKHKHKHYNSHFKHDIKRNNWFERFCPTSLLLIFLIFLLFIYIILQNINNNQ